MCLTALTLDYRAIALVLLFFIFKAAILIVKIGFLKARLRRAFKKPIFVFSAPLALETQKSVCCF
jgi:hypothetical protein